MGYAIGLIGCGGIASAWVKAVGQHADCRIALVYDLAAAAAAQRAEETGAQVASSLDEVYASDVDMVIIGTPTPSHPELVLQAAAAGKHVLCEKPMALNLDLCRQMVDACAASGVKLAIGHSLRFWDAFRTCRQLVAEGAIGAPVSGSIDRMGTVKALVAKQAQGGDAHWRDEVANSGGAALENFVHELDFTRSIFGEVAAVSCEIAGGEEHDGLLSPPLLQALVRFESGALVTTRVGSTVALPTRGYWIGGTEGGLRFAEWGGPVEHYRHDVEAVRNVPCEATNAYYLELCDLLQAVESGDEAENSGTNGLKNVALALGIYRSYETGQRQCYAEGLPVGMEGTYQNTRW